MLDHFQWNERVGRYQLAILRHEVGSCVSKAPRGILIAAKALGLPIRGADLPAERHETRAALSLAVFSCSSLNRAAFWSVPAILAMSRADNV